MNKIIAVVDTKYFNGDKKTKDNVIKLTKSVVDNKYDARSGKYNGIQKIFNEELEKMYRDLNIDGFNKLIVYEERDVGSLISSTLDYGILYNEADNHRYKRKCVDDTKGFDKVIGSVVGKNYKYIQEIFKERYRTFLAQLIGTDINNPKCVDFVVTNNLYRSRNLTTYEIINGNTSMFYDIMELYKIDNYDIKEIF